VLTAGTGCVTPQVDGGRTVRARYALRPGHRLRLHVGAVAAASSVAGVEEALQAQVAAQQRRVRTVWRAEC
jgi:hypothetical protein